MLSQVPSLNPKLEKVLEDLRKKFPANLLPLLDSVLLIGSASRGAATYRSDLDLLVVLREGPLQFERVRSLRDQFEREWLQHIQSPLPFQVNFVLPSVRSTQEPAMRDALTKAIMLIDSKTPGNAA